ncbi:hypothetical protein BaRGS_00021167, partial [Batillaria attramentaria]
MLTVDKFGQLRVYSCVKNDQYPEYTVIRANPPPRQTTQTGQDKNVPSPLSYSSVVMDADR